MTLETAVMHQRRHRERYLHVGANLESTFTLEDQEATESPLTSDYDAAKSYVTYRVPEDLIFALAWKLVKLRYRILNNVPPEL